VFVAAGPKLSKSVDVLEVVDDDEAIVRAWYFPPGVDAASASEDDATFVDLWLQGIDASRLTAQMPADFKQVFHVTGSKLFDTTCGRGSARRSTRGRCAGEVAPLTAAFCQPLQSSMRYSSANC
jgi:hypothetical protein